MIHEPDVLILDEPTSGLDPNQIVEIRNLIKHLGSAKTVILSTHILSEVQATCDRVIIINDGSIVADGTPADLQEKFHGAESVSIELKISVPDPVADIFPKLISLAGVESVEYSGGADDVHWFIVGVAKGVDVREQVFRQAVAQQWVLLEMSRKGTSLEEVFHKLTQAE